MVEESESEHRRSNLSDPSDVSETATPNPYTAPLESGMVDIARRPRSTLNFPGGMPAVALIGLASGIVTTLLIAGSMNSNNPTGAIIVAIGIWVLSAALIGGLLPGTPVRRLVRAAYTGLLSIPAYILYVPVCASATIFTSTFTRGADLEMVGLIASTVFTSTVGLTLLGLITRALARAFDRKSDAKFTQSEVPA